MDLLDAGLVSIFYLRRRNIFSLRNESNIFFFRQIIFSLAKNKWSESSFDE